MILSPSAMAADIPGMSSRARIDSSSRSRSVSRGTGTSVRPGSLKTAHRSTNATSATPTTVTTCHRLCRMGEHTGARDGGVHGNRLSGHDLRLGFDPHDPKAVVVVVNVGEVVPRIDHDTPRHGRILHFAVHVGRVEMPYLAPLGAKIAAQLAGDIEHTEAGVVRAHVE